MLYLLRNKTAQLYVTGIASGFVKEYAEYFSVGGVYDSDFQLYQYAILLGEYLYVIDGESGVASGHTLYFGSQLFLQLFYLIFKQKTVYGGAIAGAARQFALTYVESVQQVTLYQIKVSECELFVLIDSIEANECGHADIYGCILRRLLLSPLF